MSSRRVGPHRARWQGTRRPRWWALTLGATLTVGAAACALGPGRSAPLTTMACGTMQTFAYRTVPGVDPNLTSVDVYTPLAADGGGCTDRPLVVWVHGGGWAGGDKSEFMDDKVPLFNGAGFVFASVNYRITEHLADPTIAPVPRARR